MMNGLLNIVRREAQRVGSQTAQKRLGIVTSYDDAHYAVKVEIQPEGVPTGWLPLAAAAVGDGWGIYAPPSIGDVIEVDFQEGDKESGIAGARFFCASVQPLACPSGEFWFVTGGGASIKLKADGTIQSSGNWTHTGNFTATGDIVDQSATTAESMATMRGKYNSHVHPYSGGNTGTTTQTM